jgi:hypothetical protein
MKPINRAFTPIVGMALATKDGQRCGNGFVINKETKTYTLRKSALNDEIKETIEVFHIISDFGNTFKMTVGEVNELFEIAGWWCEQEDNKIEGGWYQTDFMCPVARIKRQIKLLTDVLKEME